MPSIEVLLRVKKVLIFAWMITWVITIPLFHVHVPDTTDTWATVKSGGAHTVVTPDLPGEYFHPFHDNQPGHSRHLSHRVVNSPELGIAVFDDTDDRRVQPLDILGVPYLFLDTLRSNNVYACAEKHVPFQIRRASPSLRGPPRIHSI